MAIGAARAGWLLAGALGGILVLATATDAAAQSRRGGQGYQNRSVSQGGYRHSYYRHHHRHRGYPFYGTGLGFGFGFGALAYADPVYVYEAPPVYYVPPAAYLGVIDPPYPPVPAYPPPPVGDRVVDMGDGAGNGAGPTSLVPQAALTTDDPKSWPLP